MNWIIGKAEDGKRGVDHSKGTYRSLFFLMCRSFGHSEDF